MVRESLTVKSLYVFVALVISFLLTNACYAGEAMDKFEIGNKLLSKGSAKSAVFFYDKCIKLNPNFYPAFIKRGDALKMLGKSKWAKEDYKHALKLSPGCLEAKQKLYGLKRSGKKRRRVRKKSKGPDRSGMSTKAKKGLSRSGSGMSKSNTLKPPTSD